MKNHVGRPPKGELKITDGRSYMLWFTPEEMDWLNQKSKITNMPKSILIRSYVQEKMKEK